jgi:hypothetical protein
MIDVRRLESQLSAAIRLAQELPEDAEVIGLWDRFYQTISTLPIRQQLLISGEALKELAEVTRLKSECYFGEPAAAAEEVDDTLSEEEGIFLSPEWLDGIIRKTSSLDLSRFEKPDTRLRLPGEESLDDELAADLDLIDDAELINSPAALEQALEIAHAESASDWQAKILLVLEAELEPIDFWALKNKTSLSPASLFLGLLLGSEQWYLQPAPSAIDSGYGSVLISLAKFETLLPPKIASDKPSSDEG